MPLDFTPTDEQRMLVETVRTFMEREIFPHERETERLGEVPPELGEQIKQRSKEYGLYAANMPAEIGGGGLDFLSIAMMDREIGKSTWGLCGWIGRPSQILNACEGEQRERYLLPSIRGEIKEGFGLTEPNAGSDAMGIQTRAVRDGDDWIINGSKHFISAVRKPDFIILFVVTGMDETPKGPRKRITCFLVDVGTPGFEITRGPRPVSHRTYHNYQLSFSDVRVHKRQIMGEEGKGFDLAGSWLANTRLLVASNCCGKAERALQIATQWAATRKQFGQTIGKFQGVSFKLADMATELAAGDMLTLHIAWKYMNGTMTNGDAAMAKVFCSEMAQRVTDHAIQILGGMGLMDEVPLEMLWRDTRIERIWDGTNEIQRHILSRELLRPYEA
ncbi:acyl-CoA dehydrogenase [Hypericibacter terrae]|uniref:Medium-chain specific acyl-CoA dehydrogenase, mitochondrial n=1 Tax=Hypericibacter terrae TaxID=2602015 RepID=A0A5J6MIP1_9PROT|nr:acyl-CoA dehydrogenase family protein [Hypericibacter terrae]QEX17061.1 acyl-CoA dehydrogenase [Hypericibacter terrae]